MGVAADNVLHMSAFSSSGYHKRAEVTLGRGLLSDAINTILHREMHRSLHMHARCMQDAYKMHTGCMQDTCFRRLTHLEYQAALFF